MATIEAIPSGVIVAKPRNQVVINTPKTKVYNKGVAKLLKELTANEQHMAILMDQISPVVQQINKYEERKAQLREALTVYMETVSDAPLENDVVRITYVKPSTRNTIDVTRLRSDLPELAAKYNKTTEVKSGVRITAKKVAA